MFKPLAATLAVPQLYLSAFLLSDFIALLQFLLNVEILSDAPLPAGFHATLSHPPQLISVYLIVTSLPLLGKS